MTKQLLNKYMGNEYSIGIVTYIDRYYTYFKPNIINLLKYFPDKQIIIIINGHPDKIKNILYLKEITQWLSSIKIQYITFEDHQSLSKCWNWISLMSSSENILFLNDDILIKKYFREDFEKNLSNNFDFFTINNSFSHFLLNKKIIKKVGWFDERFLGIGQEDGDYLIRMTQKNIELKNLSCRDIINYIAPSTNSSFQKISSITDNKYSSVNKLFMETKWSSINEDNDYDVDFMWNNVKIKVKLKNGMETPMFYDYKLLDTDLIFAPKLKKISNNLKDNKKIFKRYLKDILNTIKFFLK
jgi:predicted glycosyltransferase involved in capsule biosynthesis